MAGQYLGILTLMAVSFLGSFIGLIIDLKYIGLLGLVPIFIGVKSLLTLINQSTSKSQSDESEVMMKVDKSSNPARQVLSVASITIANGGDNISIYVPLYATLAIGGKVAMSLVFLLMTAAWCVIAMYLSNRPIVKNTVEKYGHIFTPFVFILLGFYILYESKTFNLLEGLQ